MRVLVTGGSGFIGARIVELLFLDGVATPIAGLRRWSSAPRVGRFPVEKRLCDVTDLAQVEEALTGVDAVVHCAVGGPEVTINGTRNVMGAAFKKGISRIVHMSTVDVYGGLEGRVDESTGIRKAGTPYGDMKVEAEFACSELIEEGAPITIIRPPIVYGPFSDLWSVRVADRLMAGSYTTLSKDEVGDCNLIYVDDLVRAVWAAIDRPETIPLSFNVNGPERMTWNDYLTEFNKVLGLAPLASERGQVAAAKRRTMQLVRTVAKVLLGHFRSQIMRLYTTSHLAKRIMRAGEQALRQTQTPAEAGLYRRRAFYPVQRARRELDWEPVVGLEEGLRLTLAWLDHHEVLDR